ncbi:orotidine-5'-phosphate decarboxylase [Cellulomonas algicola]|uniref:Orotidine-5'-phosphate decarboxylase n=1 Tax=Cellulomonas algicola TaxID=2071633 RepID=A0A401V1K2_9CELL|nr:orotidine-5'-phosphate decarboxylase [Cellulomonas algicola]GCD20790.1 orotidine 5'-phosphate decarboxylase [Cellulomonas algicola]
MTTPTPFGIRLHDAIERTGRLCVGIDPTARDLDAWSLPDDARGAARFAAAIIEASAGQVPVVKPQAAYFERFGPDGVVALADTIRLAHAAGLLVLLDAKRGDIGSTNAAYAEAYLRAGAPLGVDAMTVSPVAGVASLAPFVDVARAEGAGLFVLARTSNPEAYASQTARETDGGTVAEHVLAWLRAQNAGQDVGSFGCVFGATVDDSHDALAGLHAFVLAPGLGAQGATADDLARRFRDGRFVLPTTSRAIAAAGPSLRAVAAAVTDTVEACTDALRPVRVQDSAR